MKNALMAKFPSNSILGSLENLVDKGIYSLKVTWQVKRKIQTCGATITIQCGSCAKYPEARFRLDGRDVTLINFRLLPLEYACIPLPQIHL